MVTVIIPSRNEQLLERAVWSILNTHRTLTGIKLVVVDDGLKGRPKWSLPTQYISGRKPFCFARNINLGLAASDGDDDIFLMNDDAFFISSDGLIKLAQASQGQENVGLLSPVFSRLERTVSQRLGFLPPHSGVYVERERYLTFASVYIKRGTIIRVGQLDEQFVDYGWEDNDYCLRARLAGVELGVLPAVVMAHGDCNGGASMTFRTGARVPGQNREIFLRKWMSELFNIKGKDLEQLLWFLGFV